ncbi:NO-inducible flavohemoprotein [Loktanella sp. DJP18]|uniref:NO-inducible flavohemoprotein n=1 Tax=Loktanella sp. DJP18 TaxID=3409788 RepID=UPI003BB4DF9E
MTAALSQQTINIVKSTVPALEAHGVSITRNMYERLFRDDTIKALFNQTHHGETGSQPKALAGAVLAYARNIDRLEQLGSAVEMIAQKHVGLQIQPEHYPFVADALLAAIADVLGDAATDEIMTAWGEAYWSLAGILMGREQTLYTNAATATGGWSGWRDFVVANRHIESDVITSFLLRPVDGKSVAAHKPGQYLTFLIERTGGMSQRRNYSISAAPNGENYRISVKREPGGVISGWLHERAVPGTVLRVAPPAGEFFLPVDQTRPVVLLSGGVGFTPMVAILESLATRSPATPVHFIHGALDGSVHAMADHVRSLGKQIGAHVRIFYETPRLTDRGYDAEGRIPLTWLLENTPIRDADYFICGPTAFLQYFVTGLRGAGVAQDRIHYEYFGPGNELMAA